VSECIYNDLFDDALMFVGTGTVCMMGLNCCVRHWEVSGSN
jgi:hypothetical protein